MTNLQSVKVYKCKTFEQLLHDIDAEDLALEVSAASHIFPDDVTSLSEMLNYIYKDERFYLYANLSIALRL